MCSSSEIVLHSAVVKYYNSYTSGVDITDQKKMAHKLNHMSNYKYLHNLMDISINNALVIFAHLQDE